MCMRIAVAMLAIFLAVAGNVVAQSQSLPKAPQIKADQKADSSAKGKEAGEQDKRNASSQAAALPAPHAGNPEKNGDWDSDKTTEYWTVLGHKGRTTDWLLSLFTFCLVAVGVVQGLFLRGTFSAAKAAADAAVDASRPVLLPRVVDAGKLTLPVKTGVTSPDFSFQPELHFIFENFGKSVATITSVKYEMLVFGDIPETREFRNPRIDKNRVVIPGEYKAASPEGLYSGMNTYKARLHEPITNIDDIEPFRKGSMPFKRFFLVGVVEYVDLFGFSYEGGFALKIFPSLAQGFRGGETFNYYKYQKSNTRS